MAGVSTLAAREEIQSSFLPSTLVRLTLRSEMKILTWAYSISSARMHRPIPRKLSRKVSFALFPRFLQLLPVPSHRRDNFPS